MCLNILLKSLSVYGGVFLVQFVINDVIHLALELVEINLQVCDVFLEGRKVLLNQLVASLLEYLLLTVEY